MSQDMAPPTPAHLFLDYWRILAALTAPQRSTAPRAPTAFVETARRIAAQDDPTQAAKALHALTHHQLESERRGRMLGVMTAIDMLFAMVHPRTPRAPTRRAQRPPAWLISLQDVRVVDGYFVADDTLALVARGPLLRTAREPHATGAETFSDRFTYLGAAPRILDDRGSQIVVRFRCIGMDLLSGVLPVETAGEERIGFIPIAEFADDLDIHPIDRAGNPHAYYGPADSLACAERLLNGLKTLGEQDIAVAPELVMRASETSHVKTSLLHAPASPRLLLIGTEHSEETSEGQSYNEAVLVNSVGSELWRQRKLWPASMAPGFACQLGLCANGSASDIPEDNAAGREIELVDIDGFGRVLVLICQDLKLPAVEPLIEAVQPDWIFVPILADSIGVGRWAHRRALALSESAQSRFIGVTSATLAARYQTGPAVIGFALGPSNPASDEDPPVLQRAALFLTADPAVSPATVKTRWHGDGWVQSEIGTFGGTPADDP